MHNLLSLKIIPSKREAQVTAVAIKMIITTSKKTAHKCSERRKNKLKPYRHMRHNKWLKVFECVRVCVFVHGKEIESERKKIMLEHYVQFKTIVVMVICFFFAFIRIVAVALFVSSQICNSLWKYTTYEYFGSFARVAAAAAAAVVCIHMLPVPRLSPYTFWTHRLDLMEIKIWI